MKAEDRVTAIQAGLTARVLGYGVPQVLLATRSGLSTKHVNQMLKGHVEGTLTAWQALLDAATQGPVEGR